MPSKKGEQIFRKPRGGQKELNPAIAAINLTTRGNWSQMEGRWATEKWDLSVLSFVQC